jgi:parallel beta-helix repeat protein
MVEDFSISYNCRCNQYCEWYTLNRKLVLILVFVMLLVCPQYQRFQQNIVKASDGYPIHNINTGLNYTTIQGAIDANETLDGQTIFVDSGTYYERMTVRKSISLVGENSRTTIIDGNMSGDIIVVWADFVTIRGFTIQNSGSFSGLPSGIQVETWNCTIIDNIIVSNKGGISLLFAGNHTVENNTISSNFYGMNIVYSQDNTIFHNDFVNNSQQVFITGEINSWDNGFPAGGNYWSDYKQRHPNAKEVDNSGIWDTPYGIDGFNVDNYPLMAPYVIPEFPSFLILLLFLVATLLAITVYKRRRLTRA